MPFVLIIGKSKTYLRRDRRFFFIRDYEKPTTKQKLNKINSLINWRRH